MDRRAEEPFAGIAEPRESADDDLGPFAWLQRRVDALPPTDLTTRSEPTHTDPAGTGSASTVDEPTVDEPLTGYAETIPDPVSQLGGGSPAGPTTTAGPPSAAPTLGTARHADNRRAAPTFTQTVPRDKGPGDKWPRDKRGRRSRTEPSPVPTSATAEGLAQALRAPAHQRPRPQRGWRRAMYAVSGGSVNPGLSKAEAEEDQLIRTIGQSFAGHRSVAVMSRKGGVGKSTTTVALGSVLATYRQDNVLGVDANPDAGSLVLRVPRNSPVAEATIRDLRQAIAQRVIEPTTAPLSAVDVRQFVNLALTRFGVIASSFDPTVSAEFNDEDYRQVMAVLANFYSVIISDTGTSMVSPVIKGILAGVDQIVIPTSTVKDEAVVAASTVDWLVENGYADLARNAVTVVTTKGLGETHDESRWIVDYFADRTGAVIVVPYDKAIRRGGVFDPAEIEPTSRLAYLRLAAAVVERIVPAASRHPAG